MSGGLGQKFPETEPGGCCYGATMHPWLCTCWEPVYDRDQAEPKTDRPPGVRAGMCHDCAYRRDSPEKRGAEHAAADADELDRLVREGVTFWCHQGDRRIIAWRHPSGVEWVSPGAEFAYDPPKVDGVPYLADGSPGEWCFGWFARWYGSLNPTAEQRVTLGREAS